MGDERMDAIDFGLETGAWMNRPDWVLGTAGQLSFETRKGSDFWRQTHYGFERASGHALLFDVPPRFAAEITFSAKFETKYEQAGLLLWDSDAHWIKAGVEFADGQPTLAVVVTRGRSDWSMAPVVVPTDDWTIRLTATDSAVILHARVGDRWQILRVADFVVGQAARLGPMACSPESEGLSVAFRDFRIGPVPDEPLYLPR